MERRTVSKVDVVYALVLNSMVCVDANLEWEDGVFFRLVKIETIRKVTFVIHFFFRWASIVVTTLIIRTLMIPVLINQLKANTQLSVSSPCPLHFGFCLVNESCYIQQFVDPGNLLVGCICCEEKFI